MDKYGYDTSREIVTEKPYRGYHIIKITSKKHYWSDISMRYLDAIDKTKVEFAFAKSDDTRPSQETNCVFNSKEECKEAIDKVLDMGTIYLTNEEANRWVSTPNRKRNWSYNYNSLANVLKSYKKSNKRRRYGYLVMLENANLGAYSELLMKEEYDNFLLLAERQYPIKTDVTITIGSSAIEFKLGSEGAIELEKLINGFLEKKHQEGLIKKSAHVSKVFTSNEGTLFCK